MKNKSVKYDILLKGGRVIDPANNIDDLFDVGISGGFIANVEKNISEKDAFNTVDVTDLIVCPGLVDLHVHLFGYQGTILPDAHCLPEGTTTVVDAGGSGHITFDEFNEKIIQPSQVKIFALLNIVGEGMVGQPEQNIQGMSVDLTSEKIKERPDLIVGIKVAHNSGPTWEPIDRAIEAATDSGVFVMVDQTPTAARPMKEMMLDHLRKNDIVTHCYALSKPMTDEKDKVKEYFFRAREKGLKFDVGHGAGSFSFRIAKAAIDQNFLPDTISTDMHRDSILNNQATMPETMTKLLALGMDLQDIVKRSTTDPAKIINHPELGTLGQTAIADIAVLKVNNGDFGMTDNGTASRVMYSNKRITCEMTIKNGKVLWDRNGLSRDDWSITPPTNPLL